MLFYLKNDSASEREKSHFPRQPEEEEKTFALVPKRRDKTLLVLISSRKSNH
jgi:hypothetical protein